MINYAFLNDKNEELLMVFVIYKANRKTIKCTAINRCTRFIMKVINLHGKEKGKLRSCVITLLKQKINECFMVGIKLLSFFEDDVNISTDNHKAIIICNFFKSKILHHLLTNPWQANFLSQLRYTSNTFSFQFQLFTEHFFSIFLIENRFLSSMRNCRTKANCDSFPHLEWK